MTTEYEVLRRLVLERLHYATDVPVSRQALQDTSVEILADAVTGMAVVHLSSFLLAERLGSHTETASVAAPTTWWDHWKQDHPRLVTWWPFLVGFRLRPPRQTLHTLEATWTDWATFPHAGYKTPAERFGLPPGAATERANQVVFQRIATHTVDWDDSDPPR